jgi:hypothetical protein
VDLARVLEDPDPEYLILLQAVHDDAVAMLNKIKGG